MKELREILKLTTYRPVHGYGMELVELALSGVSKDEALETWMSKGRSKLSYQQAERDLQHRMLSDELVLSELDELGKKRMYAGDRFWQVKRLLIFGKKELAMQRAIDALVLVKRCDMTNEVANLAFYLEHYYGGIKTETRRYLRYRKIRREYQKRLNDEMNMQAMVAEFVYKVRRRKAWREMEPEVQKVAEQKEGSSLYMSQRHILLSNWYMLHGEHQKVVDIYLDTLRYFDQQSKTLSYTTQTALIHQLVPMLIASGDFAMAQYQVMKMADLSPKHEHYWHFLMYQLGLIGLWQGKYAITASALSKSAPTIKKQDGELHERWHILSAYLAFCRGEYYTTRQVAKFRNTIDKNAQYKSGANVSVIVVELLHLLATANYTLYMERCEPLKDYIAQHLKGKPNERPKAMLKALLCVEDGDYYRERVIHRAKRFVKIFSAAPATVNNYEPLPFWKVWELVLEHLR